MRPTEFKLNFPYRIQLSPGQKLWSTYDKIHGKTVIYLGLSPRLQGDSQRHRVALMQSDGSTGEEFDVFPHVIHSL